MGRDSKDAAIFVAGAAVGAAALFLLTKTAQSSKVTTKNGKTLSGNNDTAEVAAARAEVRAIFDESLLREFRHTSDDLEARQGGGSWPYLSNPWQHYCLCLVSVLWVEWSGRSPSTSKLKNVDTPRRLTMILYFA